MRVSGFFFGKATGLQPGLSLTGPDWLDSFDLLSNYWLFYRYDGFGVCFISGEREVKILSGHVRWLTN